MDSSTKIQKLRDIENEVKVCSKCPLHRNRKLPVPGEGNIEKRIILIGLGPGYHENQQGRPFIGAAGKFMNELLELAGLRRKEVYITNIIKCYLPNNMPTQEEIKTCTSYLDKQIEIIKPRIIVTLGNIATTYILQKFGFKSESMFKIHGKFFQINNLLLQAKIIPMYHPASALYSPGMKEILRTDWEYLKKSI
jgi:DNA polymerase